jgi:hypothetical protein
MALTVRHLFRIGHIRRAAPPLDRARGAHLTYLQVETGTQFGAGFDDDVLSL